MDVLTEKKEGLTEPKQLRVARASILPPSSRWAVAMAAAASAHQRKRHGS